MKNTHTNRRQFLTTGAIGLTSSLAMVQPWKAVMAAKKTSDSVHGPLTITDIEKHVIHPNFVDWHHYKLNHYLSLIHISEPTRPY